MYHTGFYSYYRQAADPVRGEPLRPLHRNAVRTVHTVVQYTLQNGDTDRHT